MDSVAGAPGSSGEEAAQTCAWCGTPAVSPDARSCRSCGAALAQRESIGDLAIPGLTAVDAALLDYDKRPLHISGPSPSQGLAPALIVGAVAGGPVGIATIGGVAAVAAVEYLGARRGGSAALADVGRPSEVALRALEHLGDGDAGGAAEPSPSVDGEVDAAAVDDGRSIWRDLPPVAREFEALEDEAQDEEGRADGR